MQQYYQVIQKLYLLRFAVPKLMLGSLFNADILALILIATAGNSLEVLTTLRNWTMDAKIRSQNYRTLWAINQLRRYGGDCFTFEAGCLVVGDLFLLPWLEVGWVKFWRE